MEQLAIHCEHKTPKTCQFYYPQNYSSDILLSIPLHCHCPILNLFDLDSCNSLPFSLTVSSCAQCKTGWWQTRHHGRSRKYKLLSLHG